MGKLDALSSSSNKRSLGGGAVCINASRDRAAGSRVAGANCNWTIFVEKTGPGPALRDLGLGESEPLRRSQTEAFFLYGPAYPTSEREHRNCVFAMTKKRELILHQCHSDLSSWALKKLFELI